MLHGVMKVICLYSVHFRTEITYSPATYIRLCVISGFRREVDENFPPLTSTLFQHVNFSTTITKPSVSCR